jgi:hypothetical protein
MNNKIIIILTLLVSCNISLYSQYTFQNIILNPDDQEINCVTEDDNGNFIMVGRKNSTELSITQAYLIRLDPSGDLLDEMVLDSTQGSSILFNVFFFNDSLFLTGSKLIDYPTISKLWYLKLDKNLIKADEKYLGMHTNSWFSYMNSIIDSDSNIVITGYTSRWDTVSPLNDDAFFYKLSLAGDSLNSKFIRSDYKLSLSYDIIEKTDQTGYYSYGFKYSNTPGEGGERFDLSKQFDSIDVMSVPQDIDYYMSPEWLNDSIIIMSGKGYSTGIPNYSLRVLTTTIENTPIDDNHFIMEGDIPDHPAMYQGLSINDNNIYVGGTSNLDYSNPFFSTLDSWFHLVKVNPDLSPIWENWYGGDAYYFLYSILATSDGGCLMVGNRYDYEIQEQERDIYVAKVNSEGLIVWTQEIQTEKALFTIYPNPGGNQVNIKMPHGEFDFELYGLNGQVLIKEQVNNEMNILNTEQLKPGIYFYRIIDSRNQVVFTGKWIRI